MVKENSVNQGRIRPYQSYIKDLFFFQIVHRYLPSALTVIVRQDRSNLIVELPGKAADTNLKTFVLLPIFAFG